MVEVKGLSKSYGDTLILNNINFVAEDGKITVVMGGSGCGKSTLLRILLGLEKPDEGEVIISFTDKTDDGKEVIFKKDITKLDSYELDRVRLKIGILFQSGALYNSMNVAENVALPIREHWSHLADEIIDGMVDIRLSQVEMSEHKYKMPAELSGGQKKRVSLARAIALEPQVVFYDEPSAGLDPIVSRGIDKLMKDLRRVMKNTSVVITHELDSAFDIADKIVLLKKADDDDDWEGAKIIAEGTPKEIKEKDDPYIISFLGYYSKHYHPTDES